MGLRKNTNLRKKNTDLYLTFIPCTNITKTITYLIPGFISILLFIFMSVYNKDLGDFDLLLAGYFTKKELGPDKAWWLLRPLFNGLNSNVKIQVAFPHLITIIMCILTSLPFFRPMYKYLKFYPCILILLAPSISAGVSAILIEIFKRIFCRPRPAETVGINNGSMPDDQYLPFIPVFDISQRSYVKEKAKIHKFSIASTLSGHVNGTVSASLSLCMNLTIFFDLIREQLIYHIKAGTSSKYIKMTKNKKTMIFSTLFSIRILVLTAAWLNFAVSSPLMMASRMTAGRHFFTDCLGAAICSVMTYSFSYLLWPDFKIFFKNTFKKTNSLLFTDNNPDELIEENLNLIKNDETLTNDPILYKNDVAVSYSSK